MFFFLKHGVYILDILNVFIIHASSIIVVIIIIIKFLVRLLHKDHRYITVSVWMH